MFSVKVDQTQTAFANTAFTVGAPSHQEFIARPAAGGGIHSLAAAPAAPGVLQGFYRLHVIEPNAVSSAPASYKLTCQQPITAGAGKLAPARAGGDMDEPAAALKSAMPSASRRALPSPAKPPLGALPIKP